MASNTQTEAFASARQKFTDLFEGTDDPKELNEGVCEILNTELPWHAWVGIYLVEGDDLVLDAWRGPEATEHVRIPIGYGLCGYAAKHAESIVVDDVSKDDRYLQCFGHTKSEVVVPIMHNGEVLGEIDVDGDEIGAFGEDDRLLLEEVAGRLGERLAAKKS
jgi:L-methionine (R)-S-oxide reductase